MALESNRSLTYPHDYRLICAGREAPTVVGGQAVALWAISYLEQGGPDLGATKYGSKDLDILADKKVLDYLKTVPGWVFKPNHTKNWTDSRKGFLYGTSEDGRKLLVEVLHSVLGLEAADLAHVETVRHSGVEYKVLDPVVMLKAKAANVRDIKPDPLSPRHDREHLQLVARCVPIYLSNMHAAGVANPVLEKETLAVVSRAFKTLQHAKTSQTLAAEGISPASLIPVQLAESPLPRIRAAYKWQFRLLAGATAHPRSPHTSVAPAVELPRQEPKHGPRMGI